MTEEKFWRIVYLYTNKYNFDIIHYKPEKKDLWLINKYNEIYRFIYLDDFNIKEVDSNIYNIIKNEKNLKRSFKLNVLKIKTIYISKNIEYNTTEYKKYKVSNSLIIERILFNENNKSNFIKNSDEQFINIETGNDKYKSRALEKYKNNSNKINLKFNLVTLSLILLFCMNYFLGNYSNKKIILYDYIDFNFYKIISGEFYRLFTDMLVYVEIKELILTTLMLLICSIFFGDNLKLGTSLLIMSIISLINSIFIILGYFENISISSLSIFGFLGAIFISELNSKQNNLKIIYSIIIPVVYIFVYSLFFETNISIYMFSFILGIFINIIFMKKLNFIISYLLVMLIIFSGIIIIIFNMNFKAKINNYMYDLSIKSFEKGNFSTDRLHYLENELKSKKRSVVSYYELGLLKLKYSSISEAKDIFLEGVEFEDNFAPTHYQLALIYRAESDFDKSKYHIEKALSIDNINKEYTDLQKELLNQ